MPIAGRVASRKASGTAYVDTSALVKLYFDEPESKETNDLLRGFSEVCLSQLAVTELISALARRCREGALSRADALTTQKAVLGHIAIGAFRCLDLTSTHHREAEALLLGSASVALRAADALHLAIARSARVNRIITFDSKMADAARALGFIV